jgi:hypothetical protein
MLTFKCRTVGVGTHSELKPGFRRNGEEQTNLYENQFVTDVGGEAKMKVAEGSHANAMKIQAQRRASATRRVESGALWFTVLYYQNRTGQ